MSPSSPLHPQLASKTMRQRLLGWHPAAVGTLTMLLFAVPMLAGIRNVQSRAVAILEDSLRSRLLSSAQGLAEVVDADLHKSFQNQEQENSAPYQEAILRMRRMQTALDPQGLIRFVYTCISDGAAIRFVLDPTPAGDADRDGQEDKAHVMELYEEATPTLRRVLTYGVAAVDPVPYTDRWGTFLSAYAPIRDAGGRVVAVAGVDMALTDYQKQLSGLGHMARLSALGTVLVSLLAGILTAAYQRRLHRTVEQLVAARDAALAGSRAKSQFLSVMSHELRTPMNAVLGMGELLADTPLTAPQQEMVGTIRHSGETLLQMITDTLDFSQLDAGSLGMKPGRIRLRQLVAEVVAAIKPLAESKGIGLHVTVAAGCPQQVLMDGEHLRKILRHLLTNAVKFTAAGNVTLAMDCPVPNRLHACISDTGPGIEAGKLAALFQAFVQVDSGNTRRHGGMGIGLALSQQLATRMGGRLWAESNEGQGSRFHFELPFETIPGGDSSPVPGAGSALLLTDDRQTAIVVRSFLEKQGYTVTETATADALKLELDRRPPQLILVDLRMPGGRAWMAGRGQGSRWVGLNGDPDEIVTESFDAILPMPVTPAGLRGVL